MNRPTSNVLAFVAALVLLPLVLILLPAVALWWLVWGSLLRLWFWFAHRRHGRFILFVYSDSPHWQSYLEKNIIPRLEPHAVVLNWSRRKSWNRDCWWEARVFHHWAGDQEFNPLALVFAGTWRVVALRFYEPFREFRHGNDERLRNVEAELFRYLSRVGEMSSTRSTWRTRV